MANLVVRNLEDDLVQALKELAARHRRSAEGEHREILRRALAGPKRRSFAAALAAIPAVGVDADFARVDDGEPRRVFD